MRTVKEKCGIVLLETENETNIILDRGNLELIKNAQIAKTINSSVIGYHLYITSNEKVKEGDWFLNNNGIHKCHSVSKNIQSGLNGGVYHIISDCKRIMASTDKSLTIVIDSKLVDKETNTHELIGGDLPQPSQQSIETFITEYNKGNVIKEVEFEFVMFDKNRKPTKDIFSHLYNGKILKINPDNTINISLPKTSWNRDEVIALIEYFEEQALYAGANSNYLGTKKWIERNL